MNRTGTTSVGVGPRGIRYYDAKTYSLQQDSITSAMPPLAAELIGTPEPINSLC